MYEFKKFYIGIIKLQDNEDESFNNLLDDGAIDLHSIYRKNNNNSVLTILYKAGYDDCSCEDIYLCLHDKRQYRTKDIGRDYCEVVMPFEEVMPKISFGEFYPKTVDDIKYLFGLIFKNAQNIKYTKERHNIDDFYVGNLNIRNLAKVDFNNYVHTNTPQIILLNNSSSVLLKNNIYNRYRTMFYRIDDDSFYNLNNFQIYSHKDLKNLSIEKDGYCDLLVPLKNELNRFRFNKFEDGITIPQVLRYEKKLIKSKKFY